MVGGPDAQNKLQVAQTSSNLPAADYPHQDNANNYHPSFAQGHQINTGTPDTIDESKALASQKITTPVAPDKLQQLKDTISEHLDCYSDICHAEYYIYQMQIAMLD